MKSAACQKVTQEGSMNYLLLTLFITFMNKENMADTKHKQTLYICNCPQYATHSTHEK
jgi:hypothetical protein